MKILHIANEIVDTGNGISNAAVDLACWQARVGHEVYFISSGGGHASLLARHGVQHIQICQKPRNLIRVILEIPKLRQTIRMISPEVIHAHMMLGALLSRFGRVVLKFGDFALVTTVHNEWRKTSQIMRCGDRVIMLSERGKALYAKRGFRLSKMTVVRHGILETPRFQKKTIAQSFDALPSMTSPIIATIAGLYRRKGIDDLIEAFGSIAEEFPTANLLIIGWGPDHLHFEAKSKVIRGGDRIHFAGFLANPQPVLKTVSIFVLPSHTESFPLALAEARAAGCALIGTFVGGIPELLEYGRAGMLVPPHDPGAIASALRQILGDEGTLNRMRKEALKNIDWLHCERMTKDTLQVYEATILERNQRKTS